MGFNRKTLGVIPITLTYFQTDPETGKFITNPETGEVQPLVMRWEFRRRAEAEARPAERDAILPGSSASRSNISTLQALLLKPPTGFDDWPTKGTLQEQIADYFGRERCYLHASGAMQDCPDCEETRLASVYALDIAEKALAYYYDCVLPHEFFRSTQNLRMEVSGAHKPDGGARAGI